MNKRNLHIDLIEKYLDNNLDMKEVELFQKTLENDEEFVRELNDMELLIDGIKKTASLTTIEEKLERFETSMKLMENEDDEKANSKPIFFDFNHIKKYSWAIAASISLVMVTSITLFNINTTPSNQKLYADYFEPFENHGTKRGTSEKGKNHWKMALFYYDIAEYEKALENFNNVNSNKGAINYPSFPLYKGNTLMMLDKHDEAKRIFLQMLEDDDGMIIQAKWFLSMCYLYENNTEKLLPLLTEISEIHASSYSKKAQEILNQI
ncbi:MAG: hypothetical protein KAR17_19065, partial [Cyclobacteriaceae bacterium]|nr:hypothetical protein [Cyclobacteriaceae bacterium]